MFCPGNNRDRPLSAILPTDVGPLPLREPKSLKEDGLFCYSRKLLACFLVGLADVEVIHHRSTDED